MRDESLWRQIEAAPTALAMRDLGLEAAIQSLMQRKFGLNADECSVALFEFRRFRYLAGVATMPLLPSPLIRFVLERDRKGSTAMNEAGPFGMFRIRPLALVLGRFLGGKGYSNALDLYQQEFGVAPPTQVWPSPAQLGRRKMALGLVVGGIAMAAVGSWSETEWLADIGLLLGLPAVFFVLFVGSWGER